MVEMVIGGIRFVLDPAAISAVRYRARYGESIVTSLANSQDKTERERHLLRVCYEMMTDRQELSLKDYAGLVYRDREEFLRQAEAAVAALLDTDGAAQQDGDGGEFDEYELLAAMAAAGLDMRLLETIPIMHVTSVLNRLGALRDPDRKTYRKLGDQELAKIYNLKL